MKTNEMRLAQVGLSAKQPHSNSQLSGCKEIRCPGARVVCKGPLLKQLCWGLGCKSGPPGHSATSNSNLGPGQKQLASPHPEPYTPPTSNHKDYKSDPQDRHHEKTVLTPLILYQLCIKIQNILNPQTRVTDAFGTVPRIVLLSIRGTFMTAYTTSPTHDIKEAWR